MAQCLSDQELCPWRDLPRPLGPNYEQAWIANDGNTVLATTLRATGPGANRRLQFIADLRRIIWTPTRHVIQTNNVNSRNREVPFAMTADGATWISYDRFEFVQGSIQLWSRPALSSQYTLRTSIYGYNIDNIITAAASPNGQILGMVWSSPNAKVHECFVFIMRIDHQTRPTRFGLHSSGLRSASMLITNSGTVSVNMQTTTNLYWKMSTDYGHSWHNVLNFPFSPNLSASFFPWQAFVGTTLFAGVPNTEGEPVLMLSVQRERGFVETNLPRRAYICGSGSPSGLLGMTWTEDGTHHCGTLLSDCPSVSFSLGMLGLSENGAVAIARTQSQLVRASPGVSFAGRTGLPEPFVKYLLFGSELTGMARESTDRTRWHVAVSNHRQRLSWDRGLDIPFTFLILINGEVEFEVLTLNGRGSMNTHFELNSGDIVEVALPAEANVGNVIIGIRHDFVRRI